MLFSQCTLNIICVITSSHCVFQLSVVITFRGALCYTGAYTEERADRCASPTSRPYSWRKSLTARSICLQESEKNWPRIYSWQKDRWEYLLSCPAFINRVSSDCTQLRRWSNPSFTRVVDVTPLWYSTYSTVLLMYAQLSCLFLHLLQNQLSHICNILCIIFPCMLQEDQLLWFVFAR